MEKNIQKGTRIKAQLHKYIDRIVPDLGKVRNKFLFEMTFGILKSGDVKISNIARSLEEPKALDDTIKRLYNNNSSHDYSTIINDASASSYHCAFNDDTIIAIDHTDIRKPYAEKMENLTIVRDGDKGDFGNGYQQIVITATQLKDANPVPLVYRLYNKIDDEKTLTDQTLEEIRNVREIQGIKGVRVLDRFFDSKHYYREFTNNDEQFVIRNKVNRKLLEVNANGKVIPGKVGIVTLAKNCKTRTRFQMKYWENGEWKKSVIVRIGCRKVFLSCINKVVTLVVVKGFGRIPMMLLTNIELSPNNIELLERILLIYRARWQCEEFIRFAKGCYNVEDIRCLNYQALKNTISFVMLAINFLTKHLGYNRKLISMKDTILLNAKAIYEEDAKLLLYRFADGIRRLLKFVAMNYKYFVDDLDAQLQTELPL
jgi:Transposase DDE domain